MQAILNQFRLFTKLDLERDYAKENVKTLLETVIDGLFLGRTWGPREVPPGDLDSYPNMCYRNAMQRYCIWFCALLRSLGQRFFVFFLKKIISWPPRAFSFETISNPRTVYLMYRASCDKVCPVYCRD